MRTLRRALIEGAMVVLPIGAIVLLILGIVHKLQEAADPLAGSYVHPTLVAVGMLVLLCLLVGQLIQSAGGRWARRLLEDKLFEKIPGYRLVKALTSDGLFGQDGGRVIRPALASIEDGQCPALVMDELDDGRFVVFVPGSPAPMSGAIYIFTPDRVSLLDVPLLPFMKAISSWGLGLRELVTTEAASRQAASPVPG
ncbi:DUF502 domain-containing protein [Roseomonas sp. HJA6]|uniref:DUF502 domain-containing protein n=1 Tax=Roseomonas alba TaxID=2846776 RepID=A0ABS7A9A5_9PROT|nr:DUF502 domain-containing protein [Neoroseomonas alba]MBW6398872.1 DUF502 domain-containing protein [Neoroseomonas alba]